MNDDSHASHMGEDDEENAADFAEIKKKKDALKKEKEDEAKQKMKMI